MIYVGDQRKNVGGKPELDSLGTDVINVFTSVANVKNVGGKPELETCYDRRRSSWYSVAENGVFDEKL